MLDRRNIAEYIRQAATARGIDPDIAVRVAGSEGLNANPAEAWQSNYVKNGQRERSYGPFQLYIDGGLGNEFMNQTGLDPRNPDTWQQQVDFSLDHAANNGWGAWYGADRVGIGEFDGIRGSGGAGNSAPSGLLGAVSTQGSTREAPDMQQQKPQGLLGGFFQDQDKLDRVSMALMSLSGFPTPGMEQMMQGIQHRMADSRKDKKSKAQANKTAEWLRSQGMHQLADGVASGALSARDALAMARQQPKGTYSQITGEQAAQLGLDPSQAYNVGPDGKITGIGGGSTNINVNTGPTGIDYGDPGKGLVWQRDQGGNVMVDERGAPIAIPYQGGSVFREMQGTQEQQQAAAESNRETKAREQDVALENISAIKDTLKRGGMFDLPETGIIGDRLARAGVNQEAVNIKNRLASLQGLIGFDRLQRMRDESPTGGALGAISERELELLSAQLGTLNQSSDKETLMSTLDRIERIYSGILEKAKAYPNADQYGFTGGQASGGQRRLRFNPETGDFE